MGTSSRLRRAVDAKALVGGVWRSGESLHDVRDPYRGDVVGTMTISSERDRGDALDAARRATAVMARMPGYERARMLHRIADSVTARAQHIGEILARESGKAISDAVLEPLRAADTIRLSAEEAVRIEGEHIPMDASPIGAGKVGMVLRFPVGVVAAITPFNGPVHLAAHKLGPALAAGNSIVLKPSPKAPLSVHAFIEAVVEADLPDGAVNVLYGDSVAPGLVSDPRVDFVSFTGSIPVGKAIRRNVGMKRVALELGGVGPTFVSDDADLDIAAKACARNAMMIAGQSCVSVQNVYVKRPAYDAFLDRLVNEIDAIRFGDPLESSTEVGTLIDEEAAERVMGMIDSAVNHGATILRGGRRSGAQLDATVLTDVNFSMDVVADEIFGPAMTVQAYDDIEPIFQEISRSPYGLQCGIFTNSLDLAMTAFRSVRTGGVIVNGTSRWRADQMPYGGVKDSGIGREGPKYAIRDMTEERLLVLN
ncbi:aldehyde dehydrogenase family protein [Rhodococcus opacus]|uniref:aldehyde dehydrogenase family protein n=1 Tax=Rhodococcus opacus TaxID=37919 RepID=UPI001C44FA2E|nr:aldehyde dehydrogenase family protein [Rhodococcus opacus]MBV6759079.1 aldehyde dehydrogenase family protein [Rhodococcus opacus]